MIHYQERVWSCSETKKQNLTFQEALESERKAIAKAEPSFPAVWIKPCLEVIHGSKKPCSSPDQLAIKIGLQC